MITRRCLALAALAAAAALCAQPVLATHYQQDLIGARWSANKNVTVLIKEGRGVTDAARESIENAIGRWNGVLQNIDGAPHLQLVTGVRSADMEISVSVGGGAILGSAQWRTESPFSCIGTRVTIKLSGKAFGNDFTDQSRENVAVHEIGHGLGLGHNTDPSDVMYATGDYGGGNVTGISDCNRLGLSTIYDPSRANECAIPASVGCQH